MYGFCDWIITKKTKGLKDVVLRGTVTQVRDIVGDRVRLAWGDEEYTKDEIMPLPEPGDKIKFIPSIRSMGCRIPEEGATVATVKRNGTAWFFKIEEDKGKHWFSVREISEVYPMNLNKDFTIDFSKDQLESGEHVVELRNKTRALYINDMLSGIDWGMQLWHYTDDLRFLDEETDHEYDVMVVYEAGRGLLLRDVLKYSHSVVWKREEDTEK